MGMRVIGKNAIAAGGGGRRRWTVAGVEARRS